MKALGEMVPRITADYMSVKTVNKLKTGGLLAEAWDRANSKTINYCSHCGGSGREPEVKSE